MVATVEQVALRTIADERVLAELRREIADLGRWSTPCQRQQVTLAALRRLRASKNEAYKVERPGYSTYAYAAYDARYDVRAMRRYLDLLAACLRADNRAQGYGAVTGRGYSPGRAAYDAAK